MKNQYSRPSLVQSSKNPESLPLHRVKLQRRTEVGFSEDWLQKLIFSNPEIIPVSEVEDIFQPLIPVCRELNTAAGPVDNIFINPKGLITIVECKLFRNPESRRAVVAQILDYAKEFTRWNYQKFESAALSARKDKSNSLYRIANPKGEEEIDEAEFVDTINRDLKRGRFLLLILGDGIRSDVENMAEFLQTHASLNFAFSLIELAVYKLPDGYPHEFLVTPRILVKTAEIGRAVIRLEAPNLVIEEPTKPTSTSETGYVRPSNLTEQEYFTKIDTLRPGLSDKLRPVLQELTDMGIQIETKSSNLTMIYYGNSTRANLGMFNLDGKFDTMRAPHGLGYLEGIKSLIPDSTIRKSKMPSVVVRNELPNIELLLDKKDDWLQLIQEIMLKLDASDDS